MLQLIQYFKYYQIIQISAQLYKILFKICKLYLVAPKYHIFDINKKEITAEDKKYRINPNQFIKEKLDLQNLYCENQAVRISGTKIAIYCDRNLNIDQYNAQDLIHIEEITDNIISLTKRILQDDIRQDLDYNSVELNYDNIKKLSHKQKLNLLCDLTEIRSECRKLLNANEEWIEYLRDGYYEEQEIRNTNGYQLRDQRYQIQQKQKQSKLQNDLEKVKQNNNNKQQLPQDTIQHQKIPQQNQNNKKYYDEKNQKQQHQQQIKQWYSVDDFIIQIKNLQTLEQVKDVAQKTKFDYIENSSFVFNNLTPILQLLTQLQMYKQAILLIKTLSKLISDPNRILPINLCLSTYNELTDDYLKNILLDYYTFIDNDTKQKLLNNIIVQLKNFVLNQQIDKVFFERNKDLYKRLNAIIIYQMILKYNCDEFLQKQAQNLEQLKNQYFMQIRKYLNITNQFLIQLPMKKQHKNKYRSIDEFLRNYVSKYQQYRNTPPVCIKQQRDFIQEAINMQGQYQKGDKLLPEYKKLRVKDNDDQICLQQVQQDLLSDISSSSSSEQQVIQNIQQNINKNQQKRIKLPQWHSSIINQVQSDLSRTQQSMVENQSIQDSSLQDIQNHQEIIDKVSTLITKELIKTQTESIVDEQVSKL